MTLYVLKDKRDRYFNQSHVGIFTSLEAVEKALAERRLDMPAHLLGRGLIYYDTVESDISIY